MRSATSPRRPTLFEALARAYPPVRGKARWIRWLQSRFQPPPYVARLRVGRAEIDLDPTDANDATYYFGIAGRSFHRLLPRILRPGDVVFDVGANVGYFAFLSADLVGPTGLVIAVEANPVLHGRLVVAARRAGVPVAAYHSAVYREATTMSFHVATHSGWSSLILNPTFKESRVVDVKTTTLDSLANAANIRRIRLLKIDIEGGEYDALLGAHCLLAERRVDYVLVEAEKHRLRAFGHTGQELAALLAGAGFQPDRLVTERRVLPIPDGLLPGEINADILYRSARMAEWSS